MDPTPEQKELEAFKTRILNLEGEITTLKKEGGESKSAQAKIKDLEDQLLTVRKEKEEIQSKIWDKKERRAKERRNIPEPEPKNKRDSGEDDDAIGGPFA